MSAVIRTPLHATRSIGLSRVMCPVDTPVTFAGIVRRTSHWSVARPAGSNTGPRARVLEAAGLLVHAGEIHRQLDESEQEDEEPQDEAAARAKHGRHVEEDREGGDGGDRRDRHQEVRPGERQERERARAPAREREESREQADDVEREEVREVRGELAAEVRGLRERRRGENRADAAPPVSLHGAGHEVEAGEREEDAGEDRQGEADVARAVERGLDAAVRQVPGQRRGVAVRVRDPEERPREVGGDRDRRREGAQPHRQLGADLGPQSRPRRRARDHRVAARNARSMPSRGNAPRSRRAERRAQSRRFAREAPGISPLPPLAGERVQGEGGTEPKASEFAHPRNAALEFAARGATRRDDRRGEMHNVRAVMLAPRASPGRKG